MSGLASRLFALVAISILATAGQSVAQSAPAAPSNLTAVAASSSSIRLNWVDNQVNPKEDGFDIERSLNGSTGWLQVGSVGADVRTFTNVGLTSGVRYYYRVQAKRGGAASAWSNVANAVPTVTTTTIA